MRKKNMTHRCRISYYSGWCTRLGRKSRFYFWSLWCWLHGAHVSPTTTIYQPQTFRWHSLSAALQRQCHDGDLASEGKAACPLTLWDLSLTACPQDRESYMWHGVLSVPQKHRKLQWGSASKALRCSLLQSAPFLDKTWELSAGSWLSLSLRINEKSWETCSRWPCLSVETLKRWPPEVPSTPRQPVLQWTTVLREESPRHKGCQHTPVCCVWARYHRWGCGYFHIPEKDGEWKLTMEKPR